MSDIHPAAPGADAPARSRRGRRIMGLILAILILMLGVSSYLLYRLVAAPTAKIPDASAAKATPSGGLEWIRSIYGTSNEAGDQFGQTQAAVPGADGTIWVTDTKARTLMHFAPDGRYLGTLNSTEPSTPLAMPSRLAVGPDGLIYVCETTNNQIHVLNPDGSDLGAIGIPQPVSVAVSADRIAVGSVSGFAILDKTGKPIKVLGTRGKGEDQFDYVHGVAFDAAQNVYVSDSYNNRLSAYDKNGKRLWIIRTGSAVNSAELKNNMLSTQEASHTALAGDDQLQLPLGVTIDGAGRLVVIDMYDCSLSVFEAKTGKFLAKYGDAGADDGQFFYPVSVGYDNGRDWFTVADAMNRRVEIVRIPGSAAGGGAAVAVVNRTLSGPLRACVLPLLLLLLAIVVALVVRSLRRRQPAPAVATAPAVVSPPVSVQPARAQDDTGAFEDI